MPIVVFPEYHAPPYFTAINIFLNTVNKYRGDIGYFTRTLEIHNAKMSFPRSVAVLVSWCF